MPTDGKFDITEMDVSELTFEEFMNWSDWKKNLALLQRICDREEFVLVGFEVVFEAFDFQMMFKLLDDWAGIAISAPSFIDCTEWFLHDLKTTMRTAQRVYPKTDFRQLPDPKDPSLLTTPETSDEETLKKEKSKVSPSVDDLNIDNGHGA